MSINLFISAYCENMCNRYYECAGCCAADCMKDFGVSDDE